MLAYRKHRTHNTRAIEVMLTTKLITIDAMARRNTAIAKDQNLELSANALRAEKTMHFPVSTDVKSTNTTNQPMERNNLEHG